MLRDLDDGFGRKGPGRFRESRRVWDDGFGTFHSGFFRDGFDTSNDDAMSPDDAYPSEALGEAAIAFFASKRKEVGVFVDGLDAVAGCASALASLGDSTRGRGRPECSLLSDFCELGERVTPAASAASGPLRPPIAWHKLAARLFCQNPSCRLH